MPNTTTKIHKYFNQKYSEWCITEFLDKSEEEPFRLKIGLYLKSLENICDSEQGKRAEKARLLHDKYIMGTRPDQQIAKGWEEERKLNKVPSINIQNSTISRNAGIFNNGGTSVTGLPKETECSPIVSERSDEQTRLLDSSSEYIPSDESEEDDELDFSPVGRKKPKKAKLKSNELPWQSPTDNQLRGNNFITGENSKMVGNYVREKTTRPLEAEDDYDRFYKRQRGQDDPIEIEEPSLDKITQEQNDDEEERMLKGYHQGGNTSPPSQPSCVVDRIDTISDTAIDYNNELDKWAKETTLQRNGEWIIGTNKVVNVRDLLTLWQNEKKRPHNDLAYYDIIDVTPGTNSDFVKKRSKDEFEEMMSQYLISTIVTSRN